ncbi:hypothetical protein Tco_1548206 [Tanacetum coccineum]
MDKCFHTYQPRIYMAQFWHTLKEDGSKYRLRFMLDKKELSLTLDDFRTIFYLPQANDNKHNSFVPPLSFSDMVPFYKQQLGFTMELKTSSSFKTTGLLQPWKTLCKIYSKCLTTPSMGRNLLFSSSSNIFNSVSKIYKDHRRHKDKVGMQIPDWMITEEMKHMEHYRMYAEVFGLDVPLTQSQPTKSIQGIHRTPSAPRSPTPKKDTVESSAPKRSTVIRFRLPERRSTRLTPTALVLTVDKADEMILQDTLQVSLTQHKSREEQEARKNVELVNKHLASEEIPDTRLEPRSDKESPEVEKTNVEEVEVTNVVIPVNVNEEEDEITDKVSPRTHTNPVSSNIKKLQELTVTHTQTTSSSRSQHTKLSRANRLLSLFKAKFARFKRYKNFFQELQGRYTYLFEHLKQRFLSRKLFDTLADHLQEVMVRSLPIIVDTHIKDQVKKQVSEQVRDQVLVYLAEGLILERQKTKEELERMIAKAILQESGNIQAEISSQIQKAIDNQIPSQVDASLQQQDIAIWLALQMKFENLQVQQNTCRPSAVRLRDQDDPHDDAHHEGENSAKRQKTSEYEAYVFGESSSGQVNEEKRGPSTSGNQEQEDDYDFWTDSYALNDDEIPSKQVSQDIMEEVSLTIDEAKLKKIADEMLRQRCTSGDEHQYHIDQIKNFLKSDIVWESRKEILVSPHPRKTTPLVQSCQRDHEAPALSLINQDLLYMKKGSSGLEKIVLWVNKCVKKFNPYAQYGVKHWKNPHAKIFYIRKQKEPGKPNEEVPDYAEIGLLWSLSVFIRSSVIWERVHDFQLGIESYQQKVNLTAPTISFPGVEKHRIVLEGLKSYNNDVKYGYVQRELTNDEVEYLKLFEEEIKVILKYRNQMRR